MSETTTIEVKREDAEQLRVLFPMLKNNAERVSALLGRYQIVKIDTLPRPDDQAAVVPVVYLQSAKNQE